MMLHGLVVGSLALLNSSPLCGGTIVSLFILIIFTQTFWVKLTLKYTNLNSTLLTNGYNHVTQPLSKRKAAPDIQELA